MKRIAMVAAVLAIGVFAFATTASSVDPPRVLGFQTLAGVEAPYLGATNAIRGVPGGGLPWQIEAAEGRLRADGRLRIEVEGLVILDDPSVPEALRGINPVPSFKAVVSCLSASGLTPTTVNLSTGLFPATTTGDSVIRGSLDLPDPCFSPIVFVTSPPSATSPTGAWFAVTGI